MSSAVRISALLAVLTCATPGGAQSVKLVETLPPAAQVHVDCRVTIEGSLTLPADKGQPARTLAVRGTSKIEYDERILKESAERRAVRTIRAYGMLDFARTIGDEEQQSGLRPDVSRLVILRHKQQEVAFCPTGPLTIGELELIRTDVFTPALRGLLPAQAVRPGERWPADADAVRELTDLERIDQGGLTCKLEGITTLLQRRLAQVSFEGKVQGLGEDGSAEHHIEGLLNFDLDSNHLASITLRGTRLIPGSNGQQGGKITGRFNLTRELRAPSPALNDASLRGLTLEPSDDNTRLLFDNPGSGIRFVYPRNWHIVGTNPRQVGLDDGRGSGLWLVIDPGPPAAAAVSQFHQAVQSGLAQQKAKLQRVGQPETLGPGLVSFSIDATVGARPVTMLYYVIQQPSAMATVTATLGGNAAPVKRDIERIVRSVQLR